MGTSKFFENKIWPGLTKVPTFSPHVRYSRFQNPVSFSFWNLESWASGQGIRNLLTIGIRNPGATANRNPVPDHEIRNLKRGIQNPTLSWITFKGKTFNTFFLDGVLDDIIWHFDFHISCRNSTLFLNNRWLLCENTSYLRRLRKSKALARGKSENPSVRTLFIDFFFKKKN